MMLVKDLYGMRLTLREQCDSEKRLEKSHERESQDRMSTNSYKSTQRDLRKPDTTHTASDGSHRAVHITVLTQILMWEIVLNNHR